MVNMCYDQLDVHPLGKVTEKGLVRRGLRVVEWVALLRFLFGV